MKEFTSYDNFEIKGRGIVYGVINDKDRFRDTDERRFLDLRPNVKIDGKVFKVLGVESFMMPDCSKGSKIGILTPYPDEKN